MAKGKVISHGVEVLALRRLSSGTTYLTEPEAEPHIGRGKTLVVMAAIQRSIGQSMTITAEDSSDRENWSEIGTLITTPAGTPEPVEYLRGTLTTPFGLFLRLKVDISGGGDVIVGIRTSVEEK